MSVIVWDGAVVAADMSLNDGRVLVPIEKLWRVGGVVLGGVGSIHDIGAMKEWVLEGRKPESYPVVGEHSCFVYVTPERGLIRYTNKPIGIAHGFNKCAFGTGRDFAYGALYIGATSVEAVKAACKYGMDCGSGIIAFQVIGEKK